jgi:hypothetical protein
MSFAFTKLKLLPNPKSWKLWTIIIAVVAGFVIFYFVRQPAKGTIKILLPTEVKNSQEEETSLWDRARQQFAKKAIKIEEEENNEEGDSVYQGKHLSFRYPNSYNLQTSQFPSGGILEKVILLSSGISQKKLAVTAIEMTGDDSLEEVSGIQMRRLKPETYQEEPLDISGKKGILFEKKEGGYEKTAFFLEGEILFTASLTSANRDSSLDTDFDSIVKGLVFI